MRVYLAQEDEELFSKSGVGRAMKHQKTALWMAGVDFTTDKKDKKWDIIHLNTVNPASYILAKEAKMRGKKVVFHAHSTEEDFRNSFALSNLLAPAFKFWLKRCYNTADVLPTPTPYSKKLLEGYGLKAPLVSISNGIDLARFAPDETKIAKFREFFEIKKGEKVVISVGHYFERKGLPDFCEVARQFPDVKFIWFGHTDEKLLTKNVKNAIARKPENVILPGYIDGEIIQGAYAGADLFFFPSYEETEGIVVLEALASKCQVLVRNIGVFEGWLHSGKNCFMAEDNEGFSKAIAEFLAGEREDTIEAGFKTAQDRSLEKIGRQLKKIYEDLMKK